MTREQFIDQTISDVTYDCWEQHLSDPRQTLEDLADSIQDRIEDEPYNLVEGKDFSRRDILNEMDEYSWGVNAELD